MTETWECEMVDENDSVAIGREISAYEGFSLVTAG